VACGEHCIETIWGRGYVLRDPAENAIAKGSSQQPVDIGTTL
jgi:hypothetical protein